MPSKKVGASYTRRLKPPRSWRKIVDTFCRSEELVVLSVALFSCAVFYNLEILAHCSAKRCVSLAIIAWGIFCEGDPREKWMCRHTGGRNGLPDFSASFFIGRARRSLAHWFSYPLLSRFTKRKCSPETPTENVYCGATKFPFENISFSPLHLSHHVEANNSRAIRAIHFTHPYTTFPFQTFYISTTASQFNSCATIFLYRIFKWISRKQDFSSRPIDSKFTKFKSILHLLFWSILLRFEGISQATRIYVNQQRHTFFSHSFNSFQLHGHEIWERTYNLYDKSQ